jgi:hypothetical protein
LKEPWRIHPTVVTVKPIRVPRRSRGFTSINYPRDEEMTHQRRRRLSLYPLIPRYYLPEKL